MVHSFTSKYTPPTSNTSNLPGANPAAPPATPPTRACAAFTYQAQSEQELTINPGDIIYVSVACCLFFNYQSHHTLHHKATILHVFMLFPLLVCFHVFGMFSCFLKKIMFSQIRSRNIFPTCNFNIK